MRKYPGFITELQRQLESLPLETLERVSRFGGLDLQELSTLLIEPRDFSVDRPDVVSEDDLAHPDKFSCESTGLSLFEEDKVAFCVLAGGAGTRIGGPKSLLKIDGEESLLTRKIRQAGKLKNIWVIVNPELTKSVTTHLSDLGLLNDSVSIIEQFESVRLTPDNQLFVFNNQASLYPCGHGDVIPALVNSGKLDSFNKTGGEHVYVVNVDNIAADIDLNILGYHHVNNSPVTCEVVKRSSTDSGGFLCNHMGTNQIVESFRMSPETDDSKFTHINTNTMIFKSNLDFSGIEWSWHRVKKNFNGNLVVQYERLLQQLTSHFKTQFVEVDRAKRFLPIKSASDLDRIKNA